MRIVIALKLGVERETAEEIVRRLQRGRGLYFPAVGRIYVLPPPKPKAESQLAADIDDDRPQLTLITTPQS
jgi:hypothetical protein